MIYKVMDINVNFKIIVYYHKINESSCYFFSGYKIINYYHRINESRCYFFSGYKIIIYYHRINESRRYFFSCHQVIFFVVENGSSFWSNANCEIYFLLICKFIALKKKCMIFLKNINHFMLRTQIK